MELTVKCMSCKGRAIIKDLSLNYKLKEVLQKMNYTRIEGGFLCGECSSKIAKSA